MLFRPKMIYDALFNVRLWLLINMLMFFYIDKTTKVMDQNHDHLSLERFSKSQSAFISFQTDQGNSTWIVIWSTLGVSRNRQFSLFWGRFWVVVFFGKVLRHPHTNFRILKIN